MTARFVLLLTFLVWLACWPAWAQNQPGVAAVILPIVTPGGYLPVSPDDLAQELESQLSRLDPRAQLQVARTADVTAFGYQANAQQPPSYDVATRLCTAYGTRYVCWVSIRFTPSYDTQSKMLAVAGAARLWVYNLDKRAVTIDQPISLVRTGMVADVSDPHASQKAEDQLALGCVDDLANQLVAVAQQKAAQAQAQAWKPAAAAPPAPSRNYQHMMEAIEAYQQASDQQSYIDLTSAEQQMSSIWLTLDKQEQDTLQKQYPGIVQLLTAPPNAGYWPYYYY
ncbi:MAG: hypothetical protein HY319_08950 [Armatimonadetes bacterium]|nr:hypothetical protein [Armatimonadota bacterium]